MLLTTSPPSSQTLKKYGLSLGEWTKMFKQQKGLCAICKLPKRLVIDHAHVLGWGKLPPEKRKLYVRALLCLYCNFFILGRGATAFKLRNAAKLLEDFERRIKCQ